MNKVFRFIGRNAKESYLGWKSFFTDNGMEILKGIGVICFVACVISIVAIVGIEVSNYFIGIANSLQSIAESLATMKGM